MANNPNNYLAAGAKVLALALYLGLVIVTCAGVWNGKREPFAIVCSIILLVLTIAAVAWLYKRARAKAIPAAEKEKEVK